MKNKKIVIGIIVVVIILLVILGVFLLNSNGNKNGKRIIKEEPLSYGQVIIENDSISKYKDKLIKDYKSYQEIMNFYNKKEELKESDFQNKEYLVILGEMGYCGGKINSISEISIDKNNVEIIFNITKTCGPCALEYYLYLIPLEKNLLLEDYKVEYQYVSDKPLYCDPEVSDKPLIYLYPEEDTKVTVRLLNSEKITTTYPKYENSWEVFAKTNGDLVDLQTGRTYYGLYWEGINTETKGIRKEGFVIRGEDTATFLEDKLEVLGLTEKEANEFIIYWLPKLEHNTYNYIYFEEIEEINKNMPLDIKPLPDSIIRINMEYKPLEEEILVEKQNLITPKRTGFTVVEWGGTELK